MSDSQILIQSIRFKLERIGFDWKMGPKPNYYKAWIVAIQTHALSCVMCAPIIKVTVHRHTVYQHLGPFFSPSHLQIQMIIILYLSIN